MTNAVTDNTISTQNVVLWQYDNATKFLAIVSLIEDFGKKSTEQLWNYFLEHVDDLTHADDFGLAVWGIFLGVSRPLLTYGGSTQSMTTDLYRDVLIARLRLLLTNGSLRDISAYAAGIFGANTIEVSDNLDMSITYSIKSGVTLPDEKAALYALSDYWQFYPAGVRDNVLPNAKFFGFKGQHAVQPTGSKITSNFGRSIFHPKAKAWSFYDDDGKAMTENLSMSYLSGTWTLTLKDEVGVVIGVAKQNGLDVTCWREYGVYFPAGSVTWGAFPTIGVLALWSERS